MLQRWVWPASGVRVVPEALEPMKTLSNRSSFPERPVRLTVTAVPVLSVEAAPTAVPRGVA